MLWCKARGLSCSVNKSLQMLLESDASYVKNPMQLSRVFG